MSSPTLYPENQIVYYGDHNGRFYAVNASTGKRIWMYQTGDRILSSPTLVVGTGTVIIGSRDGYVYLLDSENGTLKQKISLESGLTGVPVAVGDHLYVFDHLGYLYSFKTG
jgi:outer membrane protein assembly factor BamB